MTKELWIALADAAVILIGYFAVAFLAPEWQEHVTVILAAVQPFVLALIAHFYGETLAVKIAERIR